VNNAYKLHFALLLITISETFRRQQTANTTASRQTAIVHTAAAQHSQAEVVLKRVATLHHAAV